MGLCASAPAGVVDPEVEARKQTRDLDVQLNRDGHSDAVVSKVLLLGAGESGKSTIFKQMFLLYGRHAFSEEERASYTSIVHSNILLSAKTLIQQSDLLADTLGEKTKISAGLAADIEAVMAMNATDALTEDTCAAIARLWRDPGVRRTYELSARYQLTDSTEYFMERLEAAGRVGYLPSEQDVLRTRARTTGIIELDFFLDDSHFRFIDVGGQRNERKKWIHCFSGVTAVIFVAAMNEYDMMVRDGCCFVCLVSISSSVYSLFASSSNVNVCAHISVCVPQSSFFFHVVSFVWPPLMYVWMRRRVLICRTST